MELLEQFKSYLLTTKDHPNKITVKNYLSDVRKFIKWFEARFMRSFSPRLVTLDVVDEFKTQLTSHKSQSQIVSASSLKRYLSSLRKFYQFLINQNLATINPFDASTPQVIPPTDLWRVKEFKNYLFLSKASKPTIKNYLADVRQFITWVENVSPSFNALQGQTRIFPQINGKLIEEYKNRLLYDARFEARSVNRKLSSLRKYFSWAQEAGIFDNIPQFTQAPKEQLGTNTAALSLSDLQQVNSLTETTQPQKTLRYSSFPPLRLIQKISKGSNFLFELLIISPVADAALAIKYQFWKLAGKEVFAPIETMVQPSATTNVTANKPTSPILLTTLPVTPVDTFVTGHTKSLFKGVSNVSKALYAPLSISTAELTFHKKIIHHVRHSRPAWYRKYHSYRIVHYVHFGVALIYASVLGFMIYQAVIESPFRKPVVASSPGSPPRMLAFEGRLTDDTNTPITAEQNLRFGLYTSQTATGSALIWQEAQVIKPDNNGNFKTLLGKNNPIYQRLLNDNPTLFLGLTIGREEELAPRQQIATTAYSQDSELLQGLAPLTQPGAGTANVILALDSAGDLIIGGSASPRFEATGGEFTLAGRTLMLSTTADSNGNIQIVPDGSGIVDIQKPIQNTTDYNNLPGVFGAVHFDDSVAIVATSSAQSALYINQNSTGDLISASTSGIARFTVDYAGNGTFSTDLAVNGNNLTTDSPTFNLLNTHVVNLNIGSSATNISIASSSGETIINNRLVAQNGITLKSFETGAIPFIGDQNQLTQDKDNFFWARESKRLGLGTNTPLYRLDVRDDQSTGSVVQITNTNTGTDADGLIVKLGSSTPDTANNFISFQNGNGTVLGKITGNGGSNVIYNTSGADYAEYYRKANPAEQFEQGDTVCIAPTNGVTKCTQGQPILGVVSKTAGFVGAGHLENDPNYVLIGIVGQLPVKVSSNSATIASGDALTIGSDGRIIKATGKGMIAGRALTNFDPTSEQTVQIALNVGWYDPTLAINAEGNMLAEETNTQLQGTPTILDGIIDNIKLGMIEANTITTGSLSIATENITIGSLTLREYVTEIAKETTRELENQLFTRKLVSPIAELAHVKTDIISPLAEDAEIALQFDESEIKIINPNISSTSAVVSIDNEGNASFSGTLRAQRIIADQIEGLNIQAATVAANYITNVTNVYNYASASAEPTVNNQLLTTNNETLGDTTYLDSNGIASSIPDTKYQIPNTEFVTFNQGLLALGGSSFTDVGITGTLRIGESMVISDTSINTIGSELALQPLRQGNISLMGGLVTIDTEGNAVFNKDVTVHGKFAANVIVPVPNQDLLMQLPVNESGRESKFEIQTGSGSAALTVNQYGDIVASGSGDFENVKAKEFTIIRGAQADTSLTRTVAEGSGGTAVITANERERTIVTPYIKANSLIYVTPTSQTYGVTPYIARQTENSFTIQIPQPVTRDIKLNWWIVN